ncbi:DEAD/DEAH box helicase [Blastopirellula sp. JC732]|uniref:DEAD/DEAH box helicase n=1 Tax=Blastopirellula sediminis TaxID=2894196 RepID=A0A9X1MS90_9BACT|nr:DEAD/DEAH box helicase [Blastopirellula sediminis]MCC9605170.1 DEAD/DEAH box helicase [Blastopirellula sediminis]MCC9631530.1 DEAD/DEAH box helicase [Blastopirellula sediminis]
MILDQFHPIVREWFQTKFGEPTDAQAQGWPSIAGRQNTLIAAPTGSGKTLAAFMVCLDRLFRRWMAGTLRDATYVVYVSPLKALSNDIQRNLETPLEEICNLAERRGVLPPQIRTAVRTGDTPSSERQAMLRRPPHILVTTPESLYLILTAAKARHTLKHVDTVIVDEIHALARDKRGSHLTLTLERLNLVCHERPVRIGLSATQKPIEEIAAFLVGAAGEEEATPKCEIVDAGHRRDLDLQIVVPPTPLEAVCSNEQWGEVYEQLIDLINSHRSTLVFVNTRRMAERVAHRLTEALGEEVITSHHGSLSKEIRHSAEQRLKAGQLKAIVATASLEMGIDVGYIDLVVQIGSSRSIANFLQRVGRSGHSLRATPKGRLMPLTRDELIECCALMRSIRKGVLDRIEIPEKPLDILAQQIVAEVAAEECDEEELYHVFRRAYPYRNLARKDFDGVLEILNRGLTRSIKNGAYLHRDPINGKLKARRGARIAASTSGGAIPDTAQYRVVTEGEKTFVGTVDEDFAIESLAGDVFLLGNTSWRIAYVRNGEVVVNDAEGQPPSIPFWFGEAPGRTIELSSEISQLREEMAARIVASDRDKSREKIQLPALAEGLLESSFDQLDAETVTWAETECCASRYAAMQAVRYVAAQQSAIGMVPTQRQIVFERFFDESGAMQLVVHSPLGTRINRAWGLAFRKRFCRSFDFELQASADDDGIVLSLGPQHSFPLEDMFRMLTIESGPRLLEQALLAVPMFGVRWRWNVTRALALLRFVGGKKVPPHMLRFRADDLLAAAFPDQVGCLENHGADIEYPDHPIVQQTLHDCMTEAMDIDRWKQMLIDVQEGRVEFVPRDTREPSPFAHERINANPYSFLDPAPLEERRTRAVATRRTLSTSEMKELGKLSYEAISTVRQEAWPTVRDSDELHDVLASMIVLPETQAIDWRPYFTRLLEQGRAVRFLRSAGDPIWVALENLPVVQAVWPEGTAEPAAELPASLQRELESHTARVEVVRGLVPYLGPFNAEELGSQLDLPPSSVFAACEALEGEGTVLRGQFYDNPQQTAETVQWCDRRLLARIHRLTIHGLREQIKPASPEAYLRFLVRHHELLRTTKNSGVRALRKSLEQLQGFQAAAGSWERSLLAGRMDDYDGAWFDELLASGEATWGRLRPPAPSGEEQKSMASLRKSLPMTIALRANLGWLLPTDHQSAESLARGNATEALEALRQRGALFDQDLRILTKLLPTHLEEALRELAALGLITCDSFVGVREMVDEVLKKRKAKRRGGAVTRTGRWSLFPGIVETPTSDEHAQNWCWLLLARYGVVFRDVLTRESTAPPWWRLVAAFRRMERRGEIRGGRFIADVAGEQYATEATIYALRKLRNDETVDDWIAISAADPVNLFGVVTPGGRIPAIAGNSLVIRNGQIVASKRSGKIDFHLDSTSEEMHEMTRALHAGRRIPPREIPLGMPRRRSTAG